MFGVVIAYVNKNALRGVLYFRERYVRFACMPSAN